VRGAFAGWSMGVVVTVLWGGAWADDGTDATSGARTRATDRAAVCSSPTALTGGCVVKNSRPDVKCTPGAGGEAGLGGTDEFEVICGTKTKGRRCNFSREIREAVFQAYGLDYPQPRGDYELDHLIPLELGGSDDVRNLWPEAAEPKPGFHEKDQLENALHPLYCGHRLSLKEARAALTGDWVGAYRRYVLEAAGGREAAR
jgi:hypothetical protein